MNTRLFSVFAVILVLLSVVAYWLMTRDGMDMDMDMAGMAAPAAVDSNSRKPLYWVAPMDANYRRDVPGLSPMGMPLIPVYESSDTITVSPAIQQNLGLRTDVVVREDFAPNIEAVGYTHWDQSSIHKLHARAEGWLEVFNLASEGDSVLAGDVLYELFSPALVSAQREYLSARASNNASLGAVARERLMSLGFTGEQVATLEQTTRISNRLSVRAEKDAVVTQIGVREGSYVTPGTLIATLASLDTVWVEAEVFESLSTWVQVGQPAQISFTAFPGELWPSTVDYIYPNLNAVTRSLRVRFLVENGAAKLLPDMFTRVSIAGVPKRGVLTVPREAVIRSGNGDRVIQALGEGRFQPVVVRTGIANGTRLEILNGLGEGDTVVTSGQFLLDSEANGEQAFSRLTATDADSSAMPSGMQMSTPMSATSASAPADVQAADVPTYATNGEITQITPGVSVTLSHQAVPALSWPAMTMSFKLATPMDAEQLSVGDVVDFSFRRAEQGGYQIISISIQEAQL